MSENPLSPLLQVLHRLRGEEGCPWDRAQDLASAARFLADEVVEYADAAARDDLDEAQEELADLLYMVCFNWLLLSERRPVELADLAEAGAAKLRRRKPHVFAGEEARTPAQAQVIWRRQKAREKGRDPEHAPAPSALKDLSPAVSPLRQALVYGASAAETGFDWRDHGQVLRKLHEEIDELREAVAQEQPARVEDEVGDILFAATQLARKLGIDPDQALRGTNRKFARRFREMEERGRAEGRPLEDLDLDEMFAWWEAAKRNDPGRD